MLGTDVYGWLKKTQAKLNLRDAITYSHILCSAYVKNGHLTWIAAYFERRWVTALELKQLGLFQVLTNHFVQESNDCYAQAKAQREAEERVSDQAWFLSPNTTPDDSGCPARFNIVSVLYFHSCVYVGARASWDFNHLLPLQHVSNVNLRAGVLFD